MSKKIFLSLLAILASTSVLADVPAEVKVLHVTPALLKSQAHIAMPWKISDTDRIKEFNIENETAVDFNVIINVDTDHFPNGEKLGLSSTGNCGYMFLKPKQTITCSIPWGGHLELLYYGDLNSKPPFIDIEGKYTLIPNSKA